MAVRVALAEDRDEAEDAALEAEALAVGLRSGPRRPASTRRRATSGRETARPPASGITVGLAVDRSGRRERDAARRRCARIASSTLKVAMRVLLEIRRGMLGAEADVGVGREVEHDVRAGHRRR